MRIETLDELASLYQKPQKTSLAKELPRLNSQYRQLIEASPFVTIASIGPAGMDCSPRGDAAGFVAIADEQTLLIPDRRGNNRIDTLRNIVADPRVALLFFIPGVNETLRVNGQAFLTTDPNRLQQFEVDGRLPVVVIEVTIEQLFFQCARALQRSHLWDPSYHVAPDTLPSAGALIQSAVEDFDTTTYDAQLQERQKRTLY